MTITRASTQHLECIVHLCATVQNLHVRNEPERFRPFDAEAVRAFFRKAFDDPMVTFLLATEGSEVTGYALLRLNQRPENAFSKARTFLELEQIAVLPEEQGKGVGGMLVEESLKVAQSLGIGEMELTTWQFNEKAQGLFRKNGFEQCTRRMRVKV